MSDTILNTDKIKFVNKNGVEFPFNLSTPFHRAGEWVGRFMPPYEFVVSESPMVAGSRTDWVNVKSRPMEYDIVINEETPLKLRQRLREVASILNPMLGEGWIVVNTIDGKVRKIRARYESGFEVNENGDDSMYTSQRFLISFTSSRPYWLEDSEINYVFSLLSIPEGFFPILPLVLSESNIFSAKNVLVSGDDTAQPIWTITGSANYLVISNLTTGKGFSIPDLNLAPNAKVIIDTAEQTILNSDGDSLYPLMEGNLFELVQGVNKIEVKLDNAIASTSVELSFGNRWLTP